MGNDGIKGPFGGKGSYVELVKDIVPERRAAPGVILPGELGIDYLRRTVDAFGLKSGCWIWTLLLGVQAVKILVAGIHALRDHIVVTALLLV
jgi:hypothetical protein